MPSGERAPSAAEAPIEAGYRVRIEAVDGLTLSVSALEDEPDEAAGNTTEGN